MSQWKNGIFGCFGDITICRSQFSLIYTIAHFRSLFFLPPMRTAWAKCWSSRRELHDVWHSWSSTFDQHLLSYNDQRKNKGTKGNRWDLHSWPYLPSFLWTVCISSRGSGKLVYIQSNGDYLSACRKFKPLEVNPWVASNADIIICFSLFGVRQCCQI